jgi:threonine/homoserine/homoserine lactone efflux protein
MLSVNTIISFLGLNISLCFVPCPELIVVITQASLRGRNAGITFIAGVCAALVIQVLILALGISTLLKTVPDAFIILKVVGVCYLLFLAWQIYIQKFDSSNIDIPHTNLFRKGITINLTNPLTPLYLMMVLPAFLSPAQGSVFSQLLQLGAILVLVTFVMFSIFSVLGEAMGNKILSSVQLKKWVNIGAAVAMVVFSVILAFTNQPV